MTRKQSLIAQVDDFNEQHGTNISTAGTEEEIRARFEESKQSMAEKGDSAAKEVIATPATDGNAGTENSDGTDGNAGTENSAGTAPGDDGNAIGSDSSSETANGESSFSTPPAALVNSNVFARYTVETAINGEFKAFKPGERIVAPQKQIEQLIKQGLVYRKD